MDMSSYVLVYCCFIFFVFKQKTAYEMRISDWSSDVCSSDLRCRRPAMARRQAGQRLHRKAQTVAGTPVMERAKQSKAAIKRHEIGRASCRERVCQYV